ncbi:MAG: hypothetical protein PHH58_01895 [Rhodoferax sp.]|nr:hypothetical protein [Rhodoferax sp.]
MAGKRQHYVPRFLQRGFLNDSKEEAERTWLHRRGSQPRLVGIRDVGVGEYFYSNLSVDGLATLDDLITAIEGELGGDLSALRAVPVGELIDPRISARLTSHLMLRTAHVRSVFEQATAQIFDGAITLFTDLNGVRDHLGVDMFGGETVFGKAINETLEAIPFEAWSFPRPLAQRMFGFLARERFSPLYEEHWPMLSQALTEITKKFSIHIREAHNKALETTERSRWEEVLADLSWRTQAVFGAVLPDCVVLAREIGQDFTPLLLSNLEKVELVILPLAHDLLLVGSSDVNLPIAVQALNVASATCSDSFFISHRANDGAGLSDLVGQRSATAIQASVSDALSAFRGTRVVKASGIPVESRISETETVSSFSFSLTCLDFADAEKAARLGEIVKAIVQEMGRTMPLSTLDGMTFALDYPVTLETLDRGDANMRSVHSQPRDYGRAVARSVQVIRKGEFKTHIVIDSDIAVRLLSDDQDSRAFAIHVIVTRLADLAHTARYESQLRGKSTMPPDKVTEWLHTSALACPGSYFGARESAFSFPKAGEHYASMVRDSLVAAQNAIGKARLAYRVSNDLDALLSVALLHVSFVLTHAAEWLGHRDGLPDQDSFPGSSLSSELKAYDLNLWLELFGRDLRSLYDVDGQFTVANIFALSRHVERLLWTVQICPWPMEDGTLYVSVPFGDEAALLKAAPDGNG